MRLLRRIGTHLLTAVLTAGVVSLYWYGVYGSQVVGSASKGKVLTETTNSANKQRLVLGPSGLAIPVAGMNARDLIDTYAQARSGGARLHDAIDIMAPHGTPVIAAAPGTVEKMFISKGGGGITVYVRSDDKKWIYYYAHLQDYAPGLTEGQKVARGDQLGTVGSTGNANPEGPHLHFAVHKMDPSDDWHGGEPVNPYPLLARRATEG